MQSLRNFGPTSIALLALALMAGDASAQQKKQLSYKTTAADSKIAQQLNVDVGDVPNHIVRVYSTESKFGANAPVINGLKLVEQFARGTVDFIEGSGSGVQYGVFVMENGDKFFTRGTNVAQNSGERRRLPGCRSLRAAPGSLPEFRASYGR